MEAKSKLSNSQISRFKSFLSKTLFPCWIRTRGVDHRATRAVANELRESHGWRAHQCSGQFDVCVARKARETPSLTVVSTDSDLLFVGVKRLFRLEMKGKQFHCYPIKDIIEYCGLETPEEWVAAAIVSHNDYDPSVGRTSFSSAIKDIIANRKEFKGSSVDQYVAELCRRKKVKLNAVENSLDSFVNLVETPAQNDIFEDDMIDESIRRIIYRVEALILRCCRSQEPQPNQKPTTISAEVERVTGSVDGIEVRNKDNGQHKNTQPVGLKDRTIGRAGSKANVLVDEHIDNDYDDDTFPENIGTSSGAVMASISAPLSVSTEEIIAPEEDIMEKNELVERLDDNSNKDSDDESDDDSDDGFDDSNKGDYKDQHTESLPTEEEGPKKRTRKKVTYCKSSRRARDINTQLNENVAHRNINPTNLMADVVASLHPMRTMKPAQIKWCLYYSLKNSFPHMNDQLRNLLLDHLLETIQTMARVHSDLLREGLLVTSLYIARTFKKFSSIDGDRGQEHHDKRMEHFNIILLKGRRDSFFQRLVRRLIAWDSYNSKLKTSSPEMEACDEIFKEYLQITSHRQQSPFQPKDIDVCDQTFLSQCARTLSDMVGGHVYKFPLELKKRVNSLNPSWASSDSGKAILD
ncbi:hypothetical protein BGZ46_002108 [Entomortierella lignicola]|nr:hypothetical protein BGZ46_002108 [Entomortierella lignicola]